MQTQASDISRGANVVWSILMYKRHYLEQELYTRALESPEIFDFLQQGAMDGLWYWDLEHPEHEWMNAQFWELLGYDPASKDHLAAEWKDLINPDDLALAVENFERHCKDPSHPYDQYVRYRHQKGHTIWVRCRGIAIRDEKGNPKRMLGVHTDVTALKVAQAQLIHTTQQLKASNQQLDEFNAMVSHDLRTPVRGIQTYADAVMEDFGAELPNEARKLVEMIQIYAGFGLQLIEDLLQYSQVNKHNIQREQLDITALATQEFDKCCAAYPQRQARFRSLTSAGCHADRRLISRVLANLMSNAFKYADESRPLEIELSSNIDKNMLWFALRDNGIGFEMQYAERIFGLFERLQSHKDYEGTGVGLNTVKRAIELHGGSVKAEGQPGVGSVFSFSVPVS